MSGTSTPLTYDSRGIALAERGDLQGAMAAFLDAMRVDPTFAAARLHLGLALERSARPDEAAAAYMQALRLDRGLLEARYGLSSACATIGDLDGAIALLRQLLTALPDLAEAHYNLGVNLWNRYKAAPGARRAKDLDEARAELGRAVALAPSQPRFHAALGQVLADRQDLEDAVAAFRQALALEPQRPDRAYDLGLAMRLAGDFGGAESQLRSAVAGDPAHGPAHRALGLVLRTRGDLDGAAREFRAAVAASPEDAQALHLLGAVLLKRDEVEAGLDALERAIKLEPSLVEARVTLAQALARAGRRDEARRQQDEVRRLNDERAALGRAMVLVDTAAGKQRTGDGAARVSALREAVAVAPTFAEAHYQLALALTESGAPGAEVEAALRRALELRPQHAPSLHALGALAVRQGNEPAARDAFNRATTLAPGLLAAQRARASLAIAREDWAAAVAALDAVVAWEPDDAAAYLDLGQALTRQQKPEEAAASLRAAATLKGRGR